MEVAYIYVIYVTLYGAKLLYTVVVFVVVFIVIVL